MLRSSSTRAMVLGTNILPAFARPRGGAELACLSARSRNLAVQYGAFRAKMKRKSDAAAAPRGLFRHPPGGLTARAWRAYGEAMSQSSTPPAATARALLRSRDRATLATSLAGAPYASLVLTAT